jgi:hypothetical protein
MFLERRDIIFVASHHIFPAENFKKASELVFLKQICMVLGGFEPQE